MSTFDSLKFSHRYPTELPDSEANQVSGHYRYVQAGSHEEALSMSKSNGASVEMYNIQFFNGDRWVFCQTWNLS